MIRTGTKRTASRLVRRLARRLRSIQAMLRALLGKFDQDIDPDAMLSVHEVAVRLFVSTRTVWRLAKRGTLPAPVQLSRRCCRWFGADVQLALDRLRSRK